MTNYLGDFATGSTVYIYFDSFNAAGASVTMTGFAVTDIEIYKNGSTTQRSSDNGVTLLDTDGTDFDGVTGIHGFSIDTSDNTDSGFYAAGNDYTVVVSSVTIDSQTVSFIAARFSIQNRYNGVNVVQISGDSVAADNAEAFFDGTGYAGTNNVIPTVTTVNGLAANVITASSINTGAITSAKFAAGAIDAAAIAADAIGASELAADAATEIAAAVWDKTRASHVTAGTFGEGVASVQGSITGSVASVTGNVGGNVTGSVGSVTGNVGGNVTGSVGSVAAGGITASSIATDAVDADALASDAITEIVTGVLTTAMTESYNTDGSTATVAQALYGILQRLTEFSISGTTITVKKLDGSTTAMTLTLDSATTPTSSTRAS